MFKLSNYPRKGPKRAPLTPLAGSRGTRPKGPVLSSPQAPIVPSGTTPTPLEAAARLRVRALSGFQDPDNMEFEALGGVAPRHKGLD